MGACVASIQLFYMFIKIIMAMTMSLPPPPPPHLLLFIVVVYVSGVRVFYVELVRGAQQAKLELSYFKSQMNSQFFEQLL